MNFPGILHGDPGCLAKVKAAHDRGKPVDGHAPGLRGEQAAKYIAAGITTDHECFTKEEALDKLAAGCKISIREGSAARNFDALYTLLGEYPGPDDALQRRQASRTSCLLGHINVLVRRAVERGIDVYDALRAACIVPIEHYGLDVGQLRVGDPADFIEVDSLTGFQRAADLDRRPARGRERQDDDRASTCRSSTSSSPIRSEPAEIAVCGADTIRREVAGDRSARRPADHEPAADGADKSSTAAIVSDTDHDILKLVVVNRYEKAPPAVAFIKNFGLKRGAMASSVAHDSHNVIAVGVDDADIVAAVNLVMEAGGGSRPRAPPRRRSEVLPLPVAGLMATGTCEEVGAAYGKLDKLVKAWGSPLRAPYMTLSFMALLVIPALKLSDRGLFDGGKFEFTPLLLKQILTGFQD